MERKIPNSSPPFRVEAGVRSGGELLASLYLLGLDSGVDWLLVAPDGRFDGSDGALARVVAWRAGERVTQDKTLTQRRRAPGLWHSVVRPPRKE